MKLILCAKDYCYYEYNGELVFLKNKHHYKQRPFKERIQLLKQRGEI